MEYLVIYDNTGKIYYMVSGSVTEPTGLPFLWVNVPEGKRLKSINTTATPNTPIFEDAMAIDTGTCTIEELKAYLISKSEENLADYLKQNPITSKCHGGVDKLYSITKDKQAFLTQMILIATVATQTGVIYQPSWNAQGEPCTYDWTLQELQQLAFEIEMVVRPLISHQQTMAASINAAETKEAVLAVSIEF